MFQQGGTWKTAKKCKMQKGDPGHFGLIKGGGGGEGGVFYVERGAWGVGTFFGGGCTPSTCHGFSQSTYMPIHFSLETLTLIIRTG